MRAIFVALFLLSLSGLASAQGCTCNAVDSPALEWVRGKWQGSTFVFFGQVTSVTPPLIGSNEVHDQPTVNVHQSYKGHFAGGELRGAECGSTPLLGESAIFFVDGYNRIKSCSIDAPGITDEQIERLYLSFRGLAPNNAFKPKPLRSTNHMAGTACHVVGSTTQLGLT